MSECASKRKNSSCILSSNPRRLFPIEESVSLTRPIFLLPEVLTFPGKIFGTLRWSTWETHGGMPSLFAIWPVDKVRNENKQRESPKTRFKVETCEASRFNSNFWFEHILKWTYIFFSLKFYFFVFWNLHNRRVDSVGDRLITDHQHNLSKAHAELLIWCQKNDILLCFMSAKQNEVKCTKPTLLLYFNPGSEGVWTYPPWRERGGFRPLSIGMIDPIIMKHLSIERSVKRHF